MQTFEMSFDVDREFSSPIAQTPWDEFVIQPSGRSYRNNGGTGDYLSQGQVGDALAGLPATKRSELGIEVNGRNVSIADEADLSKLSFGRSSSGRASAKLL